MWSPLIFLLLGQAYLLGADPIPQTEEPHNAFWWVEHVVVGTDPNEEMLWLRELMVNDHEAAASWIRKALEDTRKSIRLFESWFANHTEVLNELKEETAVESWYIAQALTENQDAETWETLKAGRNDTEIAIQSLRETLTNDTQEITSTIVELGEDMEEVEFFLKLLVLLATAADEENNDDDDSSSDSSEERSLWKKVTKARSNEPHNALWWTKQALLTDTGNETRWLREELVRNSESATEWMKQALRNTRDTIGAMKAILQNETDALNALESETRDELWYVNQALDENQDAETWDKLKSGRNDTEKAVAWMRSNLSNSTQEILTWFRQIVTEDFDDPGSFLRLIIASVDSDENETATLSDEEDDPAFWSKLSEANRNTPYRERLHLKNMT